MEATTDCQGAVLQDGTGNAGLCSVFVGARSDAFPVVLNINVSSFKDDLQTQFAPCFSVMY